MRLSHAWTAAPERAAGFRGRHASSELDQGGRRAERQPRRDEALLGVQLFERRVRAIVFKLLYPGVQTGFVHLREAVAALSAAGGS